jgi:hypothetical protein
MKPGYKTTEFWLTMAAFIVGALIASGALTDGSTALKVVAFVGSALTALGYTAVRGFAKGKEVTTLTKKK